MLRKLLFEDIQYKVVSLIVGFLLWSAVNFGTRASLSVEREVELKNTQSNYTYKLSRKKVRIKVSFVERLVSEGALENLQPFLDVRGLNTGRHLVKVEVRNPYKFLVSVDKVEPEKVEVIIQQAPQRGGEIVLSAGEAVSTTAGASYVRVPDGESTAHKVHNIVQLCVIYVGHGELVYGYLEPRVFKDYIPFFYGVVKAHGILKARASAGNNPYPEDGLLYVVLLCYACHLLNSPLGGKEVISYLLHDLPP